MSKGAHSELLTLKVFLKLSTLQLALFDANVFVKVTHFSNLYSLLNNCEM